MGILIDIIVLCIVCIPIFIGAKKGFFKTITKFGSLVIAFVIAYLLSPGVTAKIDVAPLQGKIQQSIVSSVADDMDKLRERIGFSDKLFNLDEICDTNPVDKATEKISMILAEKILKFIVFNALFIVSYLGLLVVFMLLSGVFKLPILKGIDKTLGLIVGVFNAVLLLLIFVGIFKTALPFLQAAYPNVFATDIIEGTLLYRLISYIIPDFTLILR